VTEARLVRLLGTSPYPAVHALQEALVARRRQGGPDVVLLLEHPPTITLGRRKTAIDNVLSADGVPVVPIERGGDVTWHAPGQLVAYPIVALDGPRRDVARHLRALEDAVIAVLAGLGLVGGRDERNTGVWIDGRKTCSIGIALRQWVSWHGLALNVDVDLAGFARIRPCGFGADVMTRLADHVDPCPGVDDLAPKLGTALVDTLGLHVDRLDEARIADVADVAALVERLTA
jgi:lipoate-protein ligase B